MPSANVGPCAARAAARPRAGPSDGAGSGAPRRRTRRARRRAGPRTPSVVDWWPVRSRIVVRQRRRLDAALRRWSARTVSRRRSDRRSRIASTRTGRAAHGRDGNTAPRGPAVPDRELAGHRRRAAHAADEDFVVDEDPAYPPSGAGDHVFVRIEKRGLDHARRRCSGSRARSACSERDIGVAGMKDRHAVTRQWLSLPPPVDARAGARARARGRRRSSRRRATTTSCAPATCARTGSCCACAMRCPTCSRRGAGAGDPRRARASRPARRTGTASSGSAATATTRRSGRDDRHGRASRRATSKLARLFVARCSASCSTSGSSRG